MRNKLIAGNWKMNGSLASNEALFEGISQGLTVSTTNYVDVVLCAPALYLPQLYSLAQSDRGAEHASISDQRINQSALSMGAQDVSPHLGGAYTGEISAAMLKEFGVRFAIVGHSERRQYHGETDHTVALKAKAALAAGITPIVCVGETLNERELGQTEQVVKRQLAAVVHENGACISEIVLAYEPVWAIGTGKTATPLEAQTVHALLRSQLLAASPAAAARVRILYGGSMNAGNAAQLLQQADVDGGLIGGASLKSNDFLQIVAAALVVVTD